MIAMQICPPSSGSHCRLEMHQDHVDYIGDLETTGLWQSLALWVNRVLRSVALPRIIISSLAPRAEGDFARSKESKAVKSPTRHDRAESSDWRTAVAQAAPVDPQHPPARIRRRRRQAGMQDTQERKVLPRAFATVLARTNTTALAALARDLAEARCRRHDPMNAAVPLPRISAPFFGGGHVFYLVRFDAGAVAGVEWVVKIPVATRASVGMSVAVGMDEEDNCCNKKKKTEDKEEEDGGDALCRETLRAEALLLHMLRTETDVPVPEVIDADCRVGNEVGVPWVLMEFVRGKRLEDVWFGSEDRDENGDGRGRGRDYERRLRVRREKILGNIARVMLQLGKYEFERGGAPVFDQSDGRLAGAGPLRELDVYAMVDRWFLDEDCAPTPLYRSMGPWEDVRAMYAAWLDVYPPAEELGRGVGKLLRLLLGHIREPVISRAEGEEAKALPWSSTSTTSSSSRHSGKRGGTKTTRRKAKPFVLAHPDLSMRNILLAENGTTIKAILGWDGARAAPRSLGNEALPRWLVRDFDPFVSRWRPPEGFWRPGHALPMCNRFEDPPWVLRALRRYYARVVRELKIGLRKRGGNAGAVGEGGTNDLENRGYEEEEDGVDITKQSLLSLTLDAASRDPRRRMATLRRMMQKLSRPFEELDFDLFVDTLGKGDEVDAVRLKHLTMNIGELVDKGFVRGAVVW